MLFWFILFLITVAVSVIFALKSLGDYQERPSNFGIPYSLFLIRKPQALTADLLKRLNQSAVKSGLILSFEKLFKGERKALVIYGPVSIMSDFTKELDLLELEDYSEALDENKDSHVLVWELGPKTALKSSLETNNVSFDKLILKDAEDFWWQMVLRPVGNKEKKGKGFFGNLIKGGEPEIADPAFEIVIRSLVSASHVKEAHGLQTEVLQMVSNNGLILVPQPYSTQQLIKFYRERVGPQINLINFDKKKSPLVVEISVVRSLLGLQ